MNVPPASAPPLPPPGTPDKSTESNRQWVLVTTTIAGAFLVAFLWLFWPVLLGFAGLIAMAADKLLSPVQAHITPPGPLNRAGKPAVCKLFVTGPATPSEIEAGFVEIDRLDTALGMDLNLQSRSAMGNGMDRLVYGLTIQNPGPARQNIVARASVDKRVLRLLEDRFESAHAAGRAATPIGRALTIEIASGSKPNLADIHWEISSAPFRNRIHFVLDRKETSDSGARVYTAMVEPAREGTYEIDAYLSGWILGFPYKKQFRSTEFHVDAGSSRLVKAASRLIDQDADSQPDALAVDFDVEVKVAATYQVRYQLRAANGRSLAGSVFAALLPGGGRVTSEIGVREIEEVLQVDGTYTIDNVELYIEGLLLADVQEKMGATGPVHLIRLAREVRFALTGRNSFDLLDRDHRPGVETLLARLGFRLPPDSAECEANARLLDPLGDELARATATVVSNVSDPYFEFGFDGRRIAGKQKNGPYQVDLLHARCGGHELSLPLKVQTPSYVASQFER